MELKKQGTIQPWIDAEDNESKNIAFCSIMKKIGWLDKTVVGRSSCYMLYQLAKHTHALPGDAAEVGVWRGGTTRLLSKAFSGSGKVVHAFDTFAGMPKPDPSIDFHKEGEARASIEEVEAYLSDCDNVRLHKGLFPDTAEPLTTQTFCFVHADCDIYTSVKACCEFFYPRLERGGVMVFDDYGYYSCLGAKKAVDEYFNDRPEYPVYFYNGQAMVIKL